jgi:hypothetical protein
VRTTRGPGWAATGPRRGGFARRYVAAARTTTGRQACEQEERGGANGVGGQVVSTVAERVRRAPVGPVLPEAPAWDRRRDRRAALLLFLFVWVVYLGTASYTVDQVNDSRSATLMAWSLGARGTIDLPQAWSGEIPWEDEGVDGSIHTDRFPGSWLWAAPFHAVSEALLDRGTPPHPVLLNYAPSGVASATAAALAVVVSFLLFRRLAARRLAVHAALVLAFSTAVWSVSADALWTHSVTHLTLSLGLLAAASGRDAGSGLAFAAAIITRPQTAVVPAVVGLWRGAAARRWGPIVVIGLTSAVGVVAMAVYSRAVFGTWIPVGAYSPHKVESVATVGWWTSVTRIAGGLLDPNRGLLTTTPFLLVLALFLHRGWRRAPWWVRSGAIGGVVYFLVQMRANGYEGGRGFYGSRLTIELLVLAAPLLLRTWQVHFAGRPVWRRITLVLVAASLAIHALGAIFFSSPLRGPETWHAEMVEACQQYPDWQGCQDPAFPYARDRRSDAPG